MDMQDIILLLILSLGAIIINWSTIKKDLIQHRSVPGRRNAPVIKAEVVHKQQLPEILEEVA